MSEDFEQINENKNLLNMSPCAISSFCNDDDGKNYIPFNPCELCKIVNLDPVNLSSTSRLLEINVCLKNVCPGKEVTAGCIVMDKCCNVLAFKSQTFIANKDACSNKAEISSLCEKNTHCINVDKKFIFILPYNDLCSPFEIKVKIIANYTHPC